MAVHADDRTVVIVVLACCLLSSCSRHQDQSNPTLIVDRVPPADLGGPDKVDTIAGHTAGTAPGQHIVLYAKSEEIWWIEPFTDKPFTKS